MWLLGKLLRFLECALTVSVGANPHFSLNFCYKNIWIPLGNCKTCYGQSQTSKAVSMWIISQLFSIQKKTKPEKLLATCHCHRWRSWILNAIQQQFFAPSIWFIWIHLSYAIHLDLETNPLVYTSPTGTPNLYLLSFFAEPKNYKRGRKLEFWHFKLWCYR